MSGDPRAFNPTNKTFTRDLRKIVSNKSRKGFLIDEEDDKIGYETEGVILRIDKQKVYLKGWEVMVDEKTFWATYQPDGYITLPKNTETERYYVPTPGNNKCNIFIDERAKNHRIVNIHGLEKFLTVNGDASINLNTDTLTVGKTDVLKEIDGLKKAVAQLDKK
jgi:hypothetical protein